MPLVFQYGSNCDERRLNDRRRLNGAARDLGRAQTVSAFRIAFNKWSEQNGCAAADLIQSRRHGAPVWGVLYDLSPQALDRLTTIEGTGYRDRRIAVRDSKGLRRIVTTFVVRHQQRRTRLATTAEYVGHIVRGLREHAAPNDYVQSVIEVALETNLRAAGAEDVETQRIELLRDRQ